MPLEFRKFDLPMPKSSGFNLSENNKFTCDMGELIPFYCKPVCPGDKIKGNAQFIVELVPQIKPVMHNVDIFSYFFYVPNRILLDSWQKKFVDGNIDSLDDVLPYINLDRCDVGSLADYLGVPSRLQTKDGVTSVIDFDAPLKVSALPFRAYAMIYNEYFRDPVLQEELALSYADGEDTVTSQLLKYICWEKDYFTTCTKEQQSGDSVSFSLTGTASVSNNSGGRLNFARADTLGTLNCFCESPGSGFNSLGVSPAQENGANVVIDSRGLEADLSSVDPFKIDMFRKAMILQSYYEKLNLVGDRYEDYMKAMFGQVIPNSTLQKPMYLGGGRSKVVFSPVLQTSETTENSPQGNESGYANSMLVSNNINFNALEHGWLIGICVLKPQSGYYQGLPKHLQSFSKTDFLIPDFVGLSEQPVYKSELYATGGEEDSEVFGYNPRYSELKTGFSSVHGEFRTSLENYHLDRKFESSPVLSSEFLECKPSNRIFAYQGDEADHIRVVCGVSLYANRLLPKFSLPSGLYDKSIY